MESIRKRLIERAIKEHKEIFPTTSNDKFDENFFTTHHNQIFFWFNTKDKSTKMVVEELPEDVGETEILTL